MKKKHGFGIIGLGVIAETHAAAIGNMENAELKAVIDNDPEHARDFAKRYGGDSFTSLEKFLKCPDLEFVTITTPSGYHGDAAIAALKAGKHVIVEKPLEITTERCKKIIETANENGVTLSGIFQCRFYDSSIKIREALDQGRFGKIILCNGYSKCHRSQEYYDGGAWRGTKAVDGGGALMNQAIHTLDLLLWFCGDVKEVSCRSATMAHERIEVEDVLVSTLLFENGAMGTAEASTAVWPEVPKQIEILGTKGSVVMEEDKIVRWEFMDKKPEDENVIKQFKELDSKNYLGHKRQFEDFIRAVENGGKPLVDGFEATKAVALVEAMYKSAASGKPVSVSNL